MASSVGAQCAAGTLLGGTSLALTLTADIPQSSPTVGVSLLIGFTFWSTVNAADETLSDDGSTPGSGYNGQANGVGEGPEANGPGGTLSDGSFWNMGALAYTILNPLFIGDTVTINFGTAIDYARASVFPVFEVLDGDCTPAADLVGGTGNTDTWTGTNVALDQAVTALGDMIEFSNLGCFEVPGVTGISFTDSGLVVLDSWLDDGPGNVSYILGYQPITTSATYDSGGSITGATIPPVDGGIGGVGGNVYIGGTGVAFCEVPPTGGNPVFNNHIRLSE